MRSGRLRHLIEIQQNTGAELDSHRNPIPDWTKFVDAYADVQPVRGREQFDPVTHERFSQTIYRFRCRLSDVDGVTEQMRIVHDGKTYDIRAVLPDETKASDCIIDATVQTN